jgi:aminoglycoside 6'-N-acetyltransferase
MAVMAGDGAGDESRPVLAGRTVTIRPGRPDDVARLCEILAEPSVRKWWGQPESFETVEAKLLRPDDEVLLVLDVGGAVAGGIEYYEETDPMYRHAGIDIYLGEEYQGRGRGTEAVALLARFLVETRGHHRLVIDPAVANTGAIRCYEKVGFRAVGVMREYEQEEDGTFHDNVLMDLLAGELTTDVA